MSLDTKKIKECSASDGLEIEDGFLKLVEETGEYAAALINKLGLKNKSASSKPNTLEEGVDALICILDVLYKDGATDEQIQEMIALKTQKWEKKIDAAFYREIHLADKCL